jgi:carbohydrate-selective porin OprB
VGGDKYGFTPGVRVAYTQDLDNQDAWSASLGVFASGPHPNLGSSLHDAFWIAQLETTRRWVAGLRGTYRVYAWRNRRASDFNDVEETHTGWGVSADQQILESVAVFTRFGTELRGHVRFDRAFTLGTDIDGTAWRRGEDSLGFAIGFLRTSSDYRNATADQMLVGYAASGTERISEIYYRVRVGRHFDLTPDAQWITRPGGDRTARNVFVAGVRARVGY